MQVVHCSVVSVTASAMLQTFIYLFLCFLTSIVLDSLLRDVSSIWILTLTIHTSWHKNNGQHSYTSHSERKSQTHCKCFMQLACLVHSAAGTVKFLLSRVTTPSLQVDLLGGVKSKKWRLRKHSLLGFNRNHENRNMTVGIYWASLKNRICF